MSIIYENEKQVFHLQTKNTSYIIQIFRGKYPAHVYWGKRIGTPDMKNALLSRFIGFSAATDNEDYTLDFLSQEYPTGCGTDFRIPAISVCFEDGSRNIKPEYVGYELVAGKPKIEGLPSTYVESKEEADTLILTLADNLMNVKVKLFYTAYRELDVITRSVQVINEGEADVVLEKVLSASLDFETAEYDFISLPGAWGRERYVERTPLRSGIQSVESRRGASGHQNNPFIALAAKGADETKGSVYGFNFVYSGNFVAGAEVDQIFKTRVFMGLNDYDFSWLLKAGESFQTPEAVMVYSAAGFGGMSRTFHDLYRKHLVRGRFRDEARPILVNNWEGTYFDFTEEKILDIAKEAAGLGIELFVLDDGWFGKRNADNSSLGDWVVNREKLPNGIDGLAEKINDYGMKLGLWFEPEMISPDSDLYRMHPDWCIHTPGRVRTECRNQLTLDLSRQEVCDYIVEAVSAVLDSANIEYVKWDMNRHMTELGSAGLSPQRQKEMPHRYMLGLYDVLERITSAYPDVLFESCSGGGGRFDPGMLYYMPQTWTSDDTDAVERLAIQYGTSLVYPISTMGSHVSAVPNHQAGRITSLKMRGDVAMSGNFGYELDLTALSAEEKEMIREQVVQYKELRTFIQAGDMYRLASPFAGNQTAWQFNAKDGKDVFAAYFQVLGEVNPGIHRVKLMALEPDALYEVVGEGVAYRGDELMEIGMVVNCYGDYQSHTWRLKKIG